MSEVGLLEVRDDAGPTLQDQGMALTDAGVWLLQGRSGADPTKAKKIKTPSKMKTSGSSKKTTPTQDKRTPSGEEPNEKPAWVQNCIGKVIPQRQKEIKWAKVVATLARRGEPVPAQRILRSLKVRKVNSVKV